MKKEVFVRYANDSVYYTRIMIDPKKIENPLIFPNEVFFDIDGIRVAVKKEDWEELQKQQTEKIQNPIIGACKWLY